MHYKDQEYYENLEEEHRRLREFVLACSECKSPAELYKFVVANIGKVLPAEDATEKPMFGCDCVDGMNGMFYCDHEDAE